MMRTQDLLSQKLSHMSWSSCYHVVHYLFYSWKFVPFDHLRLPSPHPTSLVTTNFISFILFYFFTEE